jgi:hypothetical protein
VTSTPTAAVPSCLASSRGPCLRCLSCLLPTLVLHRCPVIGSTKAPRGAASAWRCCALGRSARCRAAALPPPTSITSCPAAVAVLISTLPTCRRCARPAIRRRRRSGMAGSAGLAAPVSASGSPVVTRLECPATPATRGGPGRPDPKGDGGSNLQQESCQKPHPAFALNSAIFGPPVALLSKRGRSVKSTTCASRKVR